MSVVATALRELMALGVSGDALISAVERIEEAASAERAMSLREAVEAASRKADAELAARKANGAERTRKWREKKDGCVTVTSPDVTERHGDANPRPLEQKAPTPQKTQTPTPSKNPPMGVKKVPASRRCPEQWAPSEAALQFGEAEGFSPGEIERELSKFRDHTFPTTRSDWNATFRNWLRTAAERRPRQAHERSHADLRQLARQANYAAADAGAFRAAGRDWKP